MPVVGRAVGVCALAGRVFEEEDDAVDGGELVEEGGVEGDQFFELDVFDAQVVEQEGEDSLLRMSAGRLSARSLYCTDRIGFDCYCVNELQMSRVFG